MAPKRKGSTAPSARPSKRVASGVNTPQSMSDDDYDSEGDVSDEMMSEGDKKAPKKYDSRWHVQHCLLGTRR